MGYNNTESARIRVPLVTSQLMLLRILTVLEPLNDYSHTDRNGEKSRNSTPIIWDGSGFLQHAAYLRATGCTQMLVSRLTLDTGLK